MEFLKVKFNEDLVIKFYEENPSKHLFGHAPGAYYFGAFDEGRLVGITSYTKITRTLAMMHRTLVKGSERGKGIGRFLNARLNHFLKYEEGCTKITSQIYTDNLPSIILKLKLGYKIEGLLRDHEELGRDEYVLGKLL